MITHGLGILSLIWDLRVDHPRVTQLWYSGDSGKGDNFTDICQHQDDLMVQEAPRGYFLEPPKSILVVSLRNIPQEEDFFRGYGL